MHSGKVPMFRMRPHNGTMIAAIACLLVGLAAYLNGHRDPGDVPAQERGHLFLALAVVVAGILLVIATARMWFKHLWHDRYR